MRPLVCQTVLELSKVSIAVPDSGRPNSGSGVTRRGARVLFNQFCFNMAAGEVTVLLGGSGTGKTSLLHFIAGFYRPNPAAQSDRRPLVRLLRRLSKTPEVSGTICIDGQDVSQMPPGQRGVGLVMQRYTLYEHMTVRQNLEFPLRAGIRR